MDQIGSASPELFRIFIDDMEGELSKALRKDAEGKEDSLRDSTKPVVDDVIILDEKEETI